MKESDAPLKDQASIMDTTDKINDFFVLIFTTEHDRGTFPADITFLAGTTYKENEALAEKKHQEKGLENYF